MIPYHGLSINPDSVAEAVLRNGHAFLSYADPSQTHLAVNTARSFALDNGAFSAFKTGKPIKDWNPFYEWVKELSKIPTLDFVVLPDVIEGSEKEQDALLDKSPLPPWLGAPVWHLNESMTRLKRLCGEYPRVCLGSAADFFQIGNIKWWERMAQAMAVACDAEGSPRCKLHGLRMLDPDIFQKLPLASADSSNVARNVNLERWGSNNYAPPTKETRGLILKARIEHFNAPLKWDKSKRPKGGGFFFHRPDKPHKVPLRREKA